MSRNYRSDSCLLVFVVLKTDIFALAAQNCGSSRKLLLFYYCSSCYCCRGRSIPSVVHSVVLSKGIRSFMRAATRPHTENQFAEIYRAQYENAMLVYIRGTPKLLREPQSRQSYQCQYRAQNNLSL